MVDFWIRFDKSYRLFSQFCDSSDWWDILNCIAQAITKVRKNEDGGIAILDVGCGAAISTETICELYYACEHVFPKLTLIEPSEIAVQRVGSNVVSASDGGPQQGLYRTMKELKGETAFNAILFLHSTYYIEALDTYLDGMIKSHLAPGGRVIFLVLPTSSAFFLGCPPLANTAETVIAALQRLGLTVRSLKLRSRFRIPERGFTEQQWETLQSFFLPAITAGTDQLKRLVAEHAQSGEMDFNDWLVVAERKP